ncbi:hypothetical protein IscW_ISCW013118 [Ixodes scapularis]|uniref:Uncharacterized protein n=1 Tax=Ixodes scapularis TaxID=6945 RepID=B7QCY6_IXOSC|nr:hypothetical protein IscW_ISCW013118 [Ixodes scapularis]|eukprot:XP_002413400.1 hypothetical protein IscW_ISCW013118 [Ixodes scapularis]
MSERRALAGMILVDHTLYEQYLKNSDDASAREAIVSSVATHVAAASDIYMSTNFKGVVGIRFALHILRINDSSNCRGSNPYCSSDIDGPVMLTWFSEENHDDYCLSYIWTNRDFSGGLLGVAYVAHSDGTHLRWGRVAPPLWVFDEVRGSIAAR